MTTNEIREWVSAQLVETLVDIQRQSGRESPPLRNDSIPLDDLPGFDSVNGVEAEVLLSKRLGLQLKDLEWVDLSDRHLSVGEIAAAITQEHETRLRGPGDSNSRHSGAQL